ncbi:hypothetical protein HanLR1_Chr16g0625281 [Helianthus annuus]|nr:hypothetical protein HanLR1_Chr16g0625281 [Helianthus annuus]
MTCSRNNAFRLFFMLRRFPGESEGKKRKLHEAGASVLVYTSLFVGSVATICSTCFVIRYFVVSFCILPRL